jgi:hypothetical protein
MKSTTNPLVRKREIMVRVARFFAVVMALTVLTSCTQTPEAKVFLEKPDNIVANSIPTMATLANIEVDPHKYLDPQLHGDVLGAVQGQITDVQYSKEDLTTGEDNRVLGSLAQSVMTVKVTNSTFGAPQMITVATSGGYLSPTVMGVLGRPSGDLGDKGVVEYETLGGARPPVKGDSVILFIRAAGASISPDATYSVVGASYGRFTLDPETGRFTRQMRETGESDFFEPGQVVKKFG